MKTEICKRHKVDHTGTICGACFEMYKKKAKKITPSKAELKIKKLKHTIKELKLDVQALKSDRDSWRDEFQSLERDLRRVLG